VRVRHAIVIVACSLLVAGAGPQRIFAARNVPPLQLRLSRATRLLVVSPHPDDGTAGGAGLIQRVLARGGAVRIVQMTSGDAFSLGVEASDRTDRPTVADYREYGAMRERETTAAMAALGVARSAITFLGFPDDGVCRLASDYLSEASTFESPYTRRVSPPQSEQLLAGVKYSGADIQRELQRIIATFRPSVVLVPDPHDQHPDHCATHLLVHDALAAVAVRDPGVSPVVLHYLIHYGAWPFSAEPAGTPSIAPPQPLVSTGIRWRALALTPGETEAKGRAIAAFKSQLLAMAPFLKAFDAPDELFVVGDANLPPSCWCRGEDIAASHSTSPQKSSAPAR
jgi:N-acetyl-1-D-myo-inositol-2-amino-2-deoxy-alpha-D-glucopyranoside deacetylase